MKVPVNISRFDNVKLKKQIQMTCLLNKKQLLTSKLVYFRKKNYHVALSIILKALVKGFAF